MNVTISVGGRFHAFDLAKQLQARGFLHSLITSYPKWKVAEWGIERAKVSSAISHEVLSRGLRRLGRSDLQHELNLRYDHIATKKLSRGSDLLVAWSGMALTSLMKAEELGIKTIVERGSAHISRQNEILQEEAALTGTHIALPDPRTIAQELQEYDEADYVCVPSLFAYRSFANSGFPVNKLVIVPIGVDADQFRPAPKQDAKFRVIYCGSLTLRKGVHYLLRAFHELNISDAELWLIGTGSDEIAPYLRRYGSSRVILMGAFPQNRLHEQYSQGSVLCAPSIEDGFGMVVSQAMACGLPVVCTEHTGARDLVRESVDGFVVPVRDVEALKERLNFLYSQRETARQMGESARQRIVNNFTWDHYGDRIVMDYERIIEGAPQASATKNREHSTIPTANAFSVASS